MDSVTSINIKELDNINGAIDKRASVLDVKDLDDFLIEAEMAELEFASERGNVVATDTTARNVVELGGIRGDAGVILRENDGVNQNDSFRELSVPRRPAWDEKTTATELDKREKDVFLEWRRAIARREEEITLNSSSASSFGVTPFEKNLEIWRQLWRVLERCSCMVQIVDARNPLFYLSSDLKEYTNTELGKPMVLLINKSDYLTPVQRKAWHEYFTHPDHQWEHLFFSAHEEQQQLDEQKTRLVREEKQSCQQTIAVLAEKRNSNDNESKNGDASNESELNSNITYNGYDGNHNFDRCENKKRIDQKNEKVSPPGEFAKNVGVEAPLSRTALLEWLQRFAEENECTLDPKYDRVMFGMVGFPNVGKSSVINVLMGNTKNSHGLVRVGVAARPGKTKHFQTLLVPDRSDTILCDCPGLVFPSFVNNTADLIAAGVYPIAQMRDWEPVMNLLCSRIPREVLNAQYSIKIPMPTLDAMYEVNELQGTDNIRIPPPTAEEFLTAYCIARGMLSAASGLPDYQRASRIIITEYASGKLLYCHSPPNYDKEAFQKETLMMALSKTKKLRKKLLQSNCSNSECVNNIDIDNLVSFNEEDNENDKIFLEILRGEVSSASDCNSESFKIGTSKRQKKWGKKGRKGRNKDPYGCQSNPDTLLGQSKDGTIGVSVNGGKKYGRENYTRTTGYGSMRAFKDNA